MAGGLAALLDDVAALAKMAAASIDDIGAAAARAGTKAAGVVIDDAAVTPQYVQGMAANRELPIIRRIATGSIKNKLFYIVPAVLAMSQFIPWILTPLLMLGGCYLAYEGAEKILEKLAGHSGPAKPAVLKGKEAEDRVVAGAIRTDFILSAEIMVIALNEVTEQPLLTRTITMIVVAVAITALIYGAVALIVKMDDVGLRLMQEENEGAQRLGRALVNAMPIVLKLLSVLGTAAMLWVGGHILLDGAKKLGFAAPYDFVHKLEAMGPNIGFITWLINTTASAIVGLAAGAIIATALKPLGLGHKKEAHN